VNIGEKNGYFAASLVGRAMSTRGEKKEATSVVITRNTAKLEKISYDDGGGKSG